MSALEGFYADLDSHPIEGVAIHGDTPFRVDLISQIDGNIWQGGCVNGVTLPGDFAFCINLYCAESYKPDPNGSTAFANVQLYDSTEVPLDVARKLGEAVADLAENDKVLVHCQAGLNRSSLVVAFALMARGRTASEAIALIREKRSPACLCNEHFERALLEYKP